MLVLIDARRITCAAIEDATGLATASVRRALQYARLVLGVRIVWIRPPAGYGNHGWYEIQDWGVFDPSRLRAWGRRDRRKKK